MPRVTNGQLSVWRRLLNAATPEPVSGELSSSAHYIVACLLEEVGALRMDLERFRRDARRVKANIDLYLGQAVRYADALNHISQLPSDCACRQVASKALENLD